GGVMDWGALIAGTLRLYQQALTETWGRVGTAWWVGFLPFLYGPLFFLAAVFATPLGLLGGVILCFFFPFCVSSYLYFIAGVVNESRVSLRELGESWRPFFGSVITILFFLTLVQYTLAMLLPLGEPGAQALATLIDVVLLVILNPIPELIYQ